MEASTTDQVATPNDRKPVKADLWWLITAVVLGPLLHTLAFPPFNVPEAVYVMFIPGALWIMRRQPASKVVFRWSWLGFFVSWLVLLVWLRHVTWVGMFALSAFLAVFPALWFVMAGWMIPQVRYKDFVARLLAIAALAASWTMLEFIRGMVLGGFPWLPLAASQWNRPLMLQLASATGYYGVSFLLVFISVCLAFYVKHLFWGKKKRWFSVCPEFIVAMGLWVACSFGFMHFGFKPNDRLPFFDAAVVQPFTPQELKSDTSHTLETIRTIERESQFQKAIGSDVLCLPESVIPNPLVGDPTFRALMERVSKQYGGYVITGALAVDGDDWPTADWYNCLMLLGPEHGLREKYYAKRHLVPFGEYVPFGNDFPFIRKVVPIQGDIQAGDDPAILHLNLDGRDIPVGGLICFEDIFPSLARESVLSGAQLLYVATNNGWFGEEAGAYQHATHSILRAVETRRPVLRVGNGGWSGFIDEYGNIRHVMTDETGSIYFRGSHTIPVTFDPRLNSRQSLYVKYGDWFVGLCAGLLLLGVGVVRRIADSEEDDEEAWEKLGAVLPSEDEDKD